MVFPKQERWMGCHFLLQRIFPCLLHWQADSLPLSHQKSLFSELQKGHEFERAPVVGGGQGGLVCCSPRGCRESDITELKWKKNSYLNPDF